MGKARDIEIPVEVLRERLAYDSETGVLTWKGTSHFAGKAAGSRRADGYLRILIILDGVDRRIFAHRAAYAIVHGRWPDAELDHINGDRGDNRFVNLREATHAEGAQNKKQIQSLSGLRGVSWMPSSKKWFAQIVLKGKHKHLGVFDDPDEAHKAYLVARREAFKFQPEPR